MNPIQCAASIIRRASKERPADSVLRDELKSHRSLSRGDGAEISRAVFAYFRWLGWLDPSQTLETRIVTALTLAARKAEAPASFDDSDSRTRAVPAWATEYIDVSTAWLRSLQQDPRLWLRAKRGQGHALAEKLGECGVPDAPALADAVEYQGTEDLFRAPEFQAGEFELQDISSQAVGLLCAPQPGETWWDACAGEGGKLLHLSDLMQNKGLIWASDRAEWRLKKLKFRTARAKCFNYRAALWDGGEKLPTKTKFDGVLVDAPCSGTGTWQRNPHARWTTTPDDVRELAEIQKQLLVNVAESVKPGGRLIYSVCTVTRAETAEVASALRKQCPDFQPLPLTNPLQPDAPATSHLWLWPQDCGGNGMFVAAWRRM